MRKLLAAAAILAGVVGSSVAMTGIALADQPDCPTGWYNFGVCVKDIPGNGGGNTGYGFNVKPQNGNGHY